MLETKIRDFKNDEEVRELVRAFEEADLLGRQDLDTLQCTDRLAHQFADGQTAELLCNALERGGACRNFR